MQLEGGDEEKLPEKDDWDLAIDMLKNSKKSYKEICKLLKIKNNSNYYKFI